MIKIKYSTEPFSLLITGHAGYAEHGKDIVCSAVTSAAVGGINAFNEVNKMKLTVKDGHIEVEYSKELNAHDKIVFETILTQLECIQELYPKHVKINL